MARFIEIRKINETDAAVLYSFLGHSGISGTLELDKAQAKISGYTCNFNSNAADSIRIRVEWKVLKAFEKDPMRMPDILDWIS